jgi:acylphosphatase
MVAKELRITGKVHEVGYRLFLLSEAEELLLERFVARDIVIEGKECVLVRVEGPAELLSRFVAFAESQYPPEAVVDSVEVRAYAGTVMSIDSFRQSFMVTQLAKLTQAGVSMVGRQDAMLVKQDRTIDILESVKGDTAMMLEKQDETIAAIKEESEKTREVVREEGQLTRDLMSAEGEKTREVVKGEGEKTRGVLKGTLEEEMVWVKDELIEMKATLNRVKQKVGVE